MRILQIILAKLISLAALVAGVAAVVFWFDRDYLHQAKQYFIEYVWTPWGVVAGVVVALIGLLAFLPLKRPRRKSTISFPGSHGDVTIQLDSVEATLSRVVGKMPEVKKINVRVTPSEDNRRAQVTADVWMYKTTGAAGAREIANRISDHLADSAVNILGVEDITNINLNVRGVIVDGSKQITPEPAAPVAAKVTPAPVLAPAPVVSAPTEPVVVPAPAAPAPTPSPSMPTTPEERGIVPESSVLPEDEERSEIESRSSGEESKREEPTTKVTFEDLLGPETEDSKKADSF